MKQHTWPMATFKLFSCQATPIDERTRNFMILGWEAILICCSTGAPALCSWQPAQQPGTWTHTASPQSPSPCLFCRPGMQSSLAVSQWGAQASRAWLSSGYRIWSLSQSAGSHRRSTHLRCGSPSRSGACHARGRKTHGQGGHHAPSRQIGSLHHASFLLWVVLLSDLYDQ